MKYQVGDILFVKKCEWKPRIRIHLRSHPHLHRRLHRRLHLHNTVGIITEVHKHSDIFESGSTENDNLYIWLSQVDREQYYFYENEVIGEVIK